MAVVAAVALVVGSAYAQSPAGKDTSELERPNPQQSECSQISNADERVKCLQRNQPSGAPATGKGTGNVEAPVSPSVGRETKPAPVDRPPQPTDPDAPALSR